MAMPFGQVPEELHSYKAHEHKRANKQTKRRTDGQTDEQITKKHAVPTSTEVLTEPGSVQTARKATGISEASSRSYVELQAA